MMLSHQIFMTTMGVMTCDTAEYLKYLSVEQKVIKRFCFSSTMTAFNNIDHKVVHSSSPGMCSYFVNLDKHKPTTTTLFKYCLPRDINIIIFQP